MQSLDDVDFTVLAATSVLGDLIDKCPPAEACRDAFDRMSKATIQMCMSTTGFGPQALRSLPQQQQYPTQTSPTTADTSAADADVRSDTDMQGYAPRNTANFFGQQQQQQQRRPMPRFDMNLRDRLRVPWQRIAQLELHGPMVADTHRQGRRSRSEPCTIGEVSTGTSVMCARRG